MGIDAIQLTDVQGEAAVVDHRHEELLHQLGVMSADFLARNHEAVAEMGATGAIQSHLHKGLIQRCHEVTEAMDAPTVAKSGRACPAMPTSSFVW